MEVEKLAAGPRALARGLDAGVGDADGAGGRNGTEGGFLHAGTLLGLRGVRETLVNPRKSPPIRRALWEYPYGDLNPGLQNENLMSWARLDDRGRDRAKSITRPLDPCKP